MALTEVQIAHVAEILTSSIRLKLAHYRPEPHSMPFHTRLLGKDRLALFSFIQSLNTNFGTTIFEPIAVELALFGNKNASRQVSVGGFISDQAQMEIQRIMDGLTTAETTPNKIEEIDRIRKVCQKGKLINVNPTKVDLFVEDNSGDLFLFDIKTAKPNAGQFKEFKRTLLEWVAVVLADDPSKNVTTAVAIPYNPYYPKPYARWTIRGMLDLDQELLVGDKFWDYLGGEGAYENLLNIFEKVGLELRSEIDLVFKGYK